MTAEVSFRGDLAGSTPIVAQLLRTPLLIPLRGTVHRPQFDAGAIDRPRCGLHHDTRSSPRTQLEIHLDLREGHLVAQWNEFGNALGRKDSGDPRGGEHVALRGVSACEACERRLLHADARGGHGAPRRLFLRAHGDHMRLALAVEVGERGLRARAARSARSRLLRHGARG
jgi:hypothetical protein